jgi:hypothetical protein
MIIGNPPEVQAKLAASPAKFLTLLAEQQRSAPKESDDGRDSRGL